MSDQAPDYEFFAEIEHDIKSIMSLVSKTWSKEEMDGIQEDIDYGELDLAIEQISGIIVRQGKPLTPILMCMIAHVITRLEIKNSDPVNELLSKSVGLRKKLPKLGI